MLLAVPHPCLLKVGSIPLWSSSAMAAMTAAARQTASLRLGSRIAARPVLPAGAQQAHGELACSWIAFIAGHEAADNHQAAVRSRARRRVVGCRSFHRNILRPALRTLGCAARCFAKEDFPNLAFAACLSGAELLLRRNIRQLPGSSAAGLSDAV